MAQPVFNVSKVYDPRLNLAPHLLGKGVDYVVEQGGKVQYYQAAANTAATNNITWSSITFDPNNVLSQLVWTSVPVRFTCSGTPAAGAANLLNNGVFAPRSHFYKTVTNISVKINNENLNETPNQWNISATSWYNFMRHNLFDKSTYSFSSILDNDNQYNPAANNNVLAGYENSSIFGADARGSFQNILYKITPDPDTPTTNCIVDVLYCEPLPLAPFCINDDLKCGIVGINNMNVQLTVNPIAQLLLSLSNQSGVTNFNAVPSISISNPTYGSPILHYYLLSVPPQISVAPSLEQTAYALPTTQVTQKQVSRINQGSPFNVVSDSLIPNSVPKYIYIFINESDANIQYTQPFNWLSITGITVNFANNQALLNPIILSNLGANNGLPYNIDLYKTICSKNGCKMSFQQWAQRVGSVMRIDVNEDLNIGNYNTAGEANNTSFQFTLSGFNQTSYDCVNPVLTVVFINEGMLYYNGAGAFSKYTNLSKPEMLNAQNVETNAMYYYDKSTQNFLGGLPLAALLATSLSAARKGAHAIGRVAEKAIPYVERSLPYVQRGAQALQGLGIQTGGARIAGGIQAGGIRGGNRVNPADMYNNMMQRNNMIQYDMM